MDVVSKGGKKECSGGGFFRRNASLESYATVTSSLVEKNFFFATCSLFVSFLLTSQSQTWPNGAVELLKQYNVSIQMRKTATIAINGNI